MEKNKSIQTISVIVPENPFVLPQLKDIQHCLAALDVVKLMEWWPGTPHSPHRDATKVKAIQRSLDWKRVASIAAYLLQKEILDVPDRIDKYFRDVYEPRKSEPGREWPPKVSRVIGFERSEYPTFSNVLLHVNGATIDRLENGAANLIFDERDKNLNFSVIDGQHRINGAFFALRILSESRNSIKWDIASNVFLDLDKRGAPPRNQAQIFIDVNFYQKKVDRSLVADLFPTARGPREPLGNKERAQDLGRKLMLEVGPLVGMIQIPGIRYGVKDVVTLATLNSGIENVLDYLESADIDSLEEQAEFLAQCLESWLEATGRMETSRSGEITVSSENVVYQGRVLVSVIALVPVCIWLLRKDRATLISSRARQKLVAWFRSLANRAGLLDRGKFIKKTKFRERGYLGSGGIARFRDALWAAALANRSISRLSPEGVTKLAEKHRANILRSL